MPHQGAQSQIISPVEVPGIEMFVKQTELIGHFTCHDTLFQACVGMRVIQLGFSLQWLSPVLPCKLYSSVLFPARSKNTVFLNMSLSHVITWNRRRPWELEVFLLSVLSTLSNVLSWLGSWVSHCQPVPNGSDGIFLPLLHSSWMLSGPNADSWNCWMMAWLCFLLYADCALQWFLWFCCGG